MTPLDLVNEYLKDHGHPDLAGIFDEWLDNRQSARASKSNLLGCLMYYGVQIRPWLPLLEEVGQERIVVRRMQYRLKGEDPEWLKTAETHLKILGDIYGTHGSL